MKRNLPHVGLGLHHNFVNGNPNPEEIKWAKSKLEESWGKGHRRAVIERDAPYAEQPFFDEIAEHAKQLGFKVRRESKFGHDTQLKLEGLQREVVPSFEAIHPDELTAEQVWEGRQKVGAMRSNTMTRLALRKPGTVLVGGRTHIYHASEKIAPQLDEEFEPHYNKEPDQEFIEDAEHGWELYQKSLSKKTRLPKPE